MGNILKQKLIFLGGVVLAYLIVPEIVRDFMGSNDSISGRISISLIVELGIGIFLMYNLFDIKQPLKEFIEEKVSKIEKIKETSSDLSHQLTLLMFLIAAAFILMPALGMLVSPKLVKLIKIAVVGYGLYRGYKIWSFLNKEKQEEKKQEEPNSS